MLGQKESLRHHLWAEIRNVFHLTLYFGVWFSALNLLIHATEGRGGLPLESWGFAWIKAAICAKFLVVGQLLLPMPGSTSKGVWSTILPRSFVYLLVVVVLSVLEEGLRGVLHGDPFVGAMISFVVAKPLKFLATVWVYWLILVPYLVINTLQGAPATNNG